MYGIKIQLAADSWVNTGMKQLHVARQRNSTWRGGSGRGGGRTAGRYSPRHWPHAGRAAGAAAAAGPGPGPTGPGSSGRRRGVTVAATAKPGSESATMNHRDCQRDSGSLARARAGARCRLSPG
jgi:hypothetical protein